MTRSKLFICSLLLGVCAAASAEIRVYDVEERYRQEVFEALRQILTIQASEGAFMVMHPNFGRVAMLPTGQILVDASEARHAEIEAVLEAIQRHDPADAPSISLRYWVLFATPAVPDGNDRLPPMLDSVARELEAAHGDLDFIVRDSATLVGASDSLAVSQSETLEIAQRVRPAGSRINAEIQIQTEFQELSVKATLERGQFLVLGESAQEDQAGTRGVIAFVVHWPAGVD
jgi:hypothetical protein